MTTKSLKVHNQRYVEVKKLGEGAFGVALLVRDLKDDTTK